MSSNSQNDSDPSPDEIARQNKSMVREAVKNIQSRKLPISPIPKPRRFSPASSPTQPPKKPISPIPERIKLQGVRVTPPDSPIRQRSENVTSPTDGKPKPPVRKRKKKFATNGNTESQEGIIRNSMEVSTNGNCMEVGVNRNSVDCGFVEIMALNRDRETREGGREGGRVVNEGRENSTPEKRHTVEMGEGEEVASESEKTVRNETQSDAVNERGRFESFVVIEGEMAEDGRLSALTSPDVSLPEEEEEDNESDRPTLSKQSSSSPDVIITGLTGSSPSDPSSPILAEDEATPPAQSRLGLPSGTPLAQSGKKKPPPLPAPYQARPPPVPTKRSMRRNLTDSVVAEGNTPVIIATESTGAVTTAITTVITTTAPTPPEGIHRQLSAGNAIQHRRTKSPVTSPQQQRRGNTASERQGLSPAPIFEEAESSGASSGGSGGSLTHAHSIEIRMLTSRPDAMTSKHLSYGSSDSLELSGGNSPKSK